MSFVRKQFLKNMYRKKPGIGSFMMARTGIPRLTVKVCYLEHVLVDITFKLMINSNNLYGQILAFVFFFLYYCFELRLYYN